MADGGRSLSSRWMRKAVLAASIRNRNRKVAVIGRFMSDNAVRNVVFVGCSPGTNANERIVENAVAERAEVLSACDILDCEVPWPFVQADARDLPFEDGYTDMVLANAIIEHVGDASDQARFVAEQTRVARTWVITTPNRWFPVESHTATVFKHWSSTWRARQPSFTRLLSRSEFRDLLPPGAKIHGRPWAPTFMAFYSKDDTA